MLLSPTHEEEITQLVAGELKSDKQLPMRLYQIGRKYRDEFRPRAGLLRGREFVMKDLYTFDATAEDAYISYDLVAAAYQKIFQRIGIPFVVVWPLYIVRQSLFFILYKITTRLRPTAVAWAGPSRMNTILSHLASHDTHLKLKANLLFSWRRYAANML